MTIHGITDPARFAARVPTVSVSIAGVHPRAAAEALGRDGIYAWDGDFYATGLIERLGLAEAGGVLRLGLVHYNTAAEVDRTLEAVERIAARVTERPTDPPPAGPTVRPGRAAPDQAAVGPPLDRRGRPRHRRADRHPVRGLRLRDRPDRPALGGSRRRPGVLHGAVRGLSRQRVRPDRDRHRAAGRLRGRDPDGHEPGSVGRRRGVRAGRLARGPDPLPVGSRHGTVHRGADLVRPRDPLTPALRHRRAGPIIAPGRRHVRRTGGTNRTCPRSDPSGARPPSSSRSP